MNPNYEIIEQIARLDHDAGAVTHDIRAAQRELAELAKRTKASEDLIQRTRTEMAFHEAEYRRLNKRLDELDDRKNEKITRLQGAKTDTDHRTLKRDVDNVDREIKDFQRRSDDVESRLELCKTTYYKAQEELMKSLSASADEKKKAEEAENKSASRLEEIARVRNTYLVRLDDRICQHYSRVARITRNPNGPISRVVEKACGNCFIGLAPQLLNSIALGKNVENCPSCSHILLPQASASV